ncbi:hypothetical protein [Sphingomonas lenta]|uniref:Response regulatory domain-containing protein n=1 Tax=Sphingomonas lenta TaxID=1141887 RepID=A0A2A2SCC4_9SPHN|nr:hypothetical protein [Sphingomonas lenta]PAX06954.1 hypothetical protein CKY28_12865 [Sphingomonas lenta]
MIAAASGPEALARLDARGDVRAVVTDVRMPGDPNGSGLERAFRERRPDRAFGEGRKEAARDAPNTLCSSVGDR